MALVSCYGDTVKSLKSNYNTGKKNIYFHYLTNTLIAMCNQQSDEFSCKYNASQFPFKNSTLLGNT